MALENVGVNFLAAGGDIYITTLDKSTKATNTFVSATEQGGGRVSAAGQVMIGALRKVGEIAVNTFAEAAKATIGFVKDSISVAGDFEQGMHKFQAVAGSAVDTAGLAKFKDLFISLGKELPVSTGEVEQAAIEMVSGGIDPAIVAGGALRQTIQFAAASGLSLADAAATSAKFLAGWTDSAATAEEKIAFLASSTDALTKAAAASSTTAGELRLGIFNVQGAAQALHAPFADVVATLADLAPAFESSAQAGTALNVFMSRLVPQTDKAAGVMNDLGIITKDGQNIFFDAGGNFLGMANAAEVLKTKLGGMTDQQKIATLHELFGNDAMKVGNLLMQDGAAGIDAMKAKMDAANGVSATAALMQSGYNTALENAKGSVEALQITIGSALLPVLTDLMNNVIAPGVNILTDFAAGGKVSDATFSKLSPTMQDVARVAQEVFDDIKRGIGILAAFGGELSHTIAWFGTAGAKSAELGGALNQLNGVWQLALKVITDVGNGYLAIAKAVLPIVQKIWLDHGAQILAFLKTTFDSIISIIRLALQIYDSIVPPVLNAIAGFIRDHASEIQKVFSGAWTIITNLITGTLETIKGVFKLALDVIHGDWKAAWTDIQGIATAQATAIGGIVTGFLNLIAGLFDTSMADIGKTWDDNWNMLVEIATKIGDRMVEAGANIIAGIVQGIEDNAGHLMSTLKNLAADALKAAKDALGISSPAKTFLPVGSSVVEGIMEGMSGMLPSLTDLVASLGQDLISQAKNIADAVNGAIADSFGVTATVDRQIAKNFSRLKDVGSEFLQDYIQQSLSAEQKIAEAFTDPKAGAAYFKMVSDNIFETAALQKKIDEAKTQREKDQLQQQLILISRAQDAEKQQFYANQVGAVNPMQAIADQIRQLLSNTSMPGVLDNATVLTLNGLLSQLEMAAHRAFGGPVDAGKPYWVGEDGPELFWPGQSGMVMPAATSMQMMMGGATTNNNQQTSFNMPIYTNNSPAALQQSMAIMQASMI